MRPWKVVAACGAVALVLSVGALALHGWYQRRVGAWEAERRENLARNDTTAMQRDSALSFAAAMLAERDAAVSDAQAAHARADREKRRADRLARERETLPPLPSNATPTDSLRRAEAELALAKREIQAVRVVFTETEDRATKLEEANAALTRAVDSLTAQAHRDATNAARLAKQLADAQAPCRFLFFPCPSRTVVGVIGTTLGAVGGVVIAR